MRKLFFIIVSYLFGASQSLFAQLPIEVARTISFSAEEGSNMSVDISPDGKSIVFDLLGDLYIVSSKGGLAKQLTYGVAVNTRPRWSPKGDKVAFISDATGVDRVTVIDSSGRSSQNLGESNRDFPVWNETGFWITSARKNLINDCITMYNLGGGSVNLSKDVFDIVGFSSDHKFTFCKQDNGSENWQINRFNSNTGEMDVFVDFKKSQSEIITNVNISKDSHWVSYQVVDGVSCKLVLFDLSERKDRVLAKWESSVMSGRLSSFTLHSFSADSKKIAIGYGGKIHLIDIKSGSDLIVPFIANVKIGMGELNQNNFKVFQDSLQVKYIRSAHTSPDGKRLVFSALGRVYIMDLPEGKPKLLIEQDVNQFQPAWSPDGKSIIYSSWSDKDFGHVWKVDISDLQPTRLTPDSGVYHYPSWSPDGKFITVAQGNVWHGGKPFLGDRDGPGYGKLLLISINDRSVKVIADTIPLSNRPMFSEDGKSIIYAPSRVGNSGKKWPYLVSKAIKGKVKVLATGPNRGNFFSDEFFLRQVVPSPDGRYIVYLNEDNLFLVPILNSAVPQVIYDKSRSLPVIRFARGGYDPHWEKDGRVLSWSYGNKYNQIDPDKIVDAAIVDAQKRAKAGLSDPEVFDVEISPDQNITIDLKVRGRVGNGIIALKNARIITMKGKEVIQKGTLIIRNGKFIAVGANNQISIPREVTTIDLHGKTIIPGLVDLHDHLRLQPEIFPQSKWDLLAGLAYGTTTAREPSGSHDSFGYEELIATGRMIGPRLFNVGPAVRGEKYPGITNISEACIIVRNRVQMGGTVVKQYYQESRLKRQLLLLACREEHLNMTNEVEQDMRGFLGQLKDGSSGIEHSPMWGEAYNDIIQLVAKSGTYLTPTLQVAYGTQWAKDHFMSRFSKIDSKLAKFYPEKEIVRRNLQKITINTNEPSFLNQSKVDAAIRHAGGRVTMGSHGEDPGLGAHFEIWALQMGGLTNMEALESATIMAAGALGMQQDLGSIEPGKIADLIILNKNPLDNIRNTIEIQSVMKDGVLYDGNTLDEIWPVKKKFKFNK